MPGPGCEVVELEVDSRRGGTELKSIGAEKRDLCYFKRPVAKHFYSLLGNAMGSKSSQQLIFLLTFII